MWWMIAQGSPTQWVDVPLPRDLPLPLPADRDLLAAGLVASFVAHLLFVNWTLGGALLTLWHEARGLATSDPDEDRIAHELAATVTVSKSLAVVLGVGPLLLMNVLYSTYFYAANALTGLMWMAIVPMAAVAFLLLYVHKFTWETLATRKVLHMLPLVGAIALLLTIPLVFLTNINLMLFPEKWSTVKGFWAAALLPNALPRYFHFVLASFAATGLLMVFLFGRKGSDFYDSLQRLTRPMLLRRGYRLAYRASLQQFLAGPLVLVTLPARGLTWWPLLNLVVGVGLASSAVLLLRQEFKAADDRIGRRFGTICLLLGGTVVFMALTRHFYREEMLREHRFAVEATTREFEIQSAAAWADRDRADATMPPGERNFKAYCSGCHAIDRELAAPAVREIATLHAGKPENIVAWAKAPGRKRPQFAARPMPPMTHLPDPVLRSIAEYMLTVGNGTAAGSGSVP